MNVDFSIERAIFKKELEQTQQDLSQLQQRLKQLPNVNALRAQLVRLKLELNYINGDKARPKSTPKPQKLKVELGQKQTRRKKSEMLQMRADIKSVVRMLGRQGKIFTNKEVLNGMKAQDYDGNVADGQIMRQALVRWAKQGWLEQIGRGKWKITEPQG